MNIEAYTYHETLKETEREIDAIQFNLLPNLKTKKIFSLAEMGNAMVLMYNAGKRTDYFGAISEDKKLAKMIDSKNYKYIQKQSATIVDDYNTVMEEVMTVLNK